MSDDPNRQPQLPSWMWLFTGIVTGLFIAFLYYLSGIKVPAEGAPDNDKKQPAKTATNKESASTKSSAYEFYNVLKEKQTLTPTSMPSDAKPAPPSTAQKITSKGQFIVQTGSFSQAKDANKRRAELLLMGFDVNVEKVAIPSAGTFHRVQVGPFQSGPALDEALKILAENKIDTLVLEHKP